MFLTLFGTVVIAGIVGYASERTGWTRNGIIPSIIICIGGAFLFFFLRIMFGIDDLWNLRYEGDHICTTSSPRSTLLWTHATTRRS